MDNLRIIYITHNVIGYALVLAESDPCAGQGTGRRVWHQVLRDLRQAQQQRGRGLPGHSLRYSGETARESRALRHGWRSESAERKEVPGGGMLLATMMIERE